MKQRAERVAIPPGNRQGGIDNLIDAGACLAEQVATDAGEPVEGDEIRLGKGLIFEVVKGDVVPLEILLRDGDVSAFAERAPDDRLDVDGLRLEVGAVHWIDGRVPQRILRAAHDEPLERDFGGSYERLR